MPRHRPGAQGSLEQCSALLLGALASTESSRGARTVSWQYLLVLPSGPTLPASAADHREAKRQPIPASRRSFRAPPTASGFKSHESPSLHDLWRTNLGRRLRPYPRPLRAGEAPPTTRLARGCWCFYAGQVCIAAQANLSIQTILRGCSRDPRATNLIPFRWSGLPLQVFTRSK